MTPLMLFIVMDYLAILHFPLIVNPARMNRLGHTSEFRRQYGGSTAAVRRQYCGSTAAVLRQYGGSTAAVLRQYRGSTAAVPRQCHGSILIQTFDSIFP